MVFKQTRDYSKIASPLHESAARIFFWGGGSASSGENVSIPIYSNLGAQSKSETLGWFRKSVEAAPVP